MIYLIQDKRRTDPEFWKDAKEDDELARNVFATNEEIRDRVIKEFEEHDQVIAEMQAEGALIARRNQIDPATADA